MTSRTSGEASAMMVETYQSKVSIAAMLTIENEMIRRSGYPEHELVFLVLFLERLHRLAKRLAFILVDRVAGRENRLPVVHERGIETNHVVDFRLERHEKELVMNFMRDALFAEDHLVQHLIVALRDGR